MSHCCLGSLRIFGLLLGLLGSLPVIAAANEGTLALIPAPALVQMHQGAFALRSGTPLSARGADAERAARYLSARLARDRDIVLSLGHERRDGIALDVDPAAFAADASAEAYRLEVAPRHIRIVAPDARGLFYGAVTLWQLATTDAATGPVAIPALLIEDAPRFAWRGYMLDSARHFASIDQIEALLDAMALHKLNVFHWHLTDDQGWRVQIRAYPQLTRVGGCRIPAERPGAAAECGWYTQAQIRQLVAYAARRNITVVPEIDMPGHATAAIAAYPQLGVSGERIAVSNARGVHANIFNVEESTFTFLDTVLDEIAELFPGPFVHVGGDEAIKDQWNASTRVQARMRELGIADPERLQAYFIGRMQRSLASHGKRLIGWDEILEGGLPANAAVMSWRGTAGGLQAARAGHDVVMSPTRDMYLDYLQTASPNEPHGRLALNTLRRFYEFEPVPAELPAAQARHILGLQSNLWTGALSTFATIEHNTFPRLAATAETGWSPVARKNYGDFLVRLPAQLQRYRRLGIGYAQTPFEVWADAQPAADGKATISLQTPLDYAIRYTLDGSAPTAVSARYREPFTATLPARVRATAFSGETPLAAALDTTVDTASLHRRDDTRMAPCPNPPGPSLRLAGAPAADGKRALYNVDILAPCWQWRAAPIAGMTRLRARAARLPYDFHLTADERARQRFLPAQSAHGELDVRGNGCDGEVVARTRLPARTPAQAPIEVIAPLDHPVADTDLCIRFSGGFEEGLWVLDDIELMP